MLVLYYSESSEDFLFYSYKYRWLFSFFLWSSAILFPPSVSINYLGFSFVAFPEMWQALFYLHSSQLKVKFQYSILPRICQSQYVM